MTKLCTKCGEVKPLDLFGKNASSPDGKLTQCKACVNARNRAWREENWDKQCAANKAWRERNRDKFLSLLKRWHVENPERSKSKALLWRKSHKHMISATRSRRRAAELNATPKWADQSKIRVFYLAAHIATLVIGEPYHVDHIIPLQNKDVCGLHVHTNLQLLAARKNHSKSNSFDRTQPGAVI